MPVEIRGMVDDGLKLMRAALLEYEKQHPAINAVIYRRENIPIRLRVIDPAFAGLDRPERHDRIWEFLKTLPEEVQSDISMIVPLAPGEEKTSIANFEFEHPSPLLTL